jgi:hypothetical protein
MYYFVIKLNYLFNGMLENLAQIPQLGIKTI